MNFIVICCFIFTFFNCVKPKEANDEWENPIDNFFAFPEVLDVVTKNDNVKSEIDNHFQKLTDIIVSDEKTKIVPVFESVKQENTFQSREQHPSHSYLLRIVNIILHYTKLKSSELYLWQDETTATVEMTFSDKTLKTLQKFSAGQSVPYDELDECFVSLFKINDHNKDENAQCSGSAEYSFYLLILAGLLVVIGLIFYLGKTAAQSIPKLLFNITLMIFFLFYASSIGISLWGQYEDIWAKRIMEFSETADFSGQIPDECFPNKMALHKRVFNFATGDKTCEKYWNSRKSILVELDFGKAFTGSFFNLIFQFLPEFGDSLGSCIKRFSDYFPWPLNWIMNIVMPFVLIKSFFQGIPILFQALGFLSRRQRLLQSNTQQEVEHKHELPPTQPVNNWYIFGNNAGDFPPISLSQQNTRNRQRMQEILKKQKEKKAQMLSNVLLKRKQLLRNK